MGKFALRYKVQNGPAPRQRTVIASFFFVIRSVAGILLIGFMLGLGWVMFTGDVSSAQRFLNF